MPSDDIDITGAGQESSKPGRAVSQSELDALISAFETKERRAQDVAPAAVPLTLDPIPRSPVKPVPVASLMLNAKDASDMEALIRQAAAPQTDTPEARESEIEDALARLAGAAAGDATDSERSAGYEFDAPETEDLAPAPEEDAPASLRAHVRDLAEMVAEESLLDPAADGADQADDFSDIEKELANPAALTDPDTPAVESDDMEAVLAGEAVAEPVQASAPAAKMREPAAVAKSASRETAPGPDSVTRTSVIEEIGSENIAAGAPPEFTAPAAPPILQPAPKPIPAKAQTPAVASKEPAPPAEEPKPRRIWLPPSFLALAREQPARTLVAAGVGLLTAVLTFSFLYGNQLRPAAAPVGDAREQMPFDRAMRTAEAMVEEHDYTSAAKLLGAALARENGESEEVIAAKFLFAHALYLATAESLTDSEAEPIHAAIDDAVAAGHENPKTTDALMWKAGLYERQGNVPAARAELRGILDNYASAPNRDAVLLALAELELRNSRRAEAIDAADKLLTEFPNSPLTSRARIVQGDAYVKGGNTKVARAAYLLAATERGDAGTETDATERLGQLALDAGQPQAAIDQLLKRLDSSTSTKGNDVVYLALSRAYRAAKQPEKARNVLNELVDFFPDSNVMPEALVELSRVLEDLGLTAEAGRLVNRAVDRFPSNPTVLRRAGQMLSARGEPAAAGKMLLSAYDAGAHEPAVLLDAGDQFLKGEDAVSAQNAYARLIEEHGAAPEALDAKIGWAKAARGLGRLDDAIARFSDLSRATEGGPKQLVVLRAQADLYRDLGLEGELIKTYGKVAAVTKEPAPLAEAAERLIEAGAEDEGLQVASRVEVARLDPPLAYAFLNAWGKSLLRKDADEALGVLTRAHEQYPQQRTAEGVQTVLRAMLTLNRSVQARALVADLQARAAAPNATTERECFERAAVQYGDFLFRRGDYTQAIDAYAMLAPLVKTEPAPADAAKAPEKKTEPTDAQRWGMYQSANSLYAMGSLVESLPLYDAIGVTAAPYAGDAKARAELVRFELRRRGQLVPGTAPAAKAAS